jgi:uncharacterized linocin/CFP29 family protein
VRREDGVVGTRGPDGAVAWEKERLRAEGVVAADLDGRRLVAVHDPALDTAHVYANPDDLAVEAGEDGVVVDGETRSPDDLPLDGVLAFDAMWFAWVGFYPDTVLHA